MMKEHYDVVVMGGGLGGLVCANILAKEGRSVCLLEKNNQYGGNLQTFVREKTIFDTGVHYIGGLSEGQNLYQYFKYLDIIDELALKKLNEDGFDIITFDDDVTEYKHAQGYENFIQTLLKQFPKEENALRAYCDKIVSLSHKFPLYRLKLGSPYMDEPELFRLKAKAYIDSVTTNKKLRAVLAGSNFLYAGEADKTPLYVHALSVNSYIQSAYRCINGGSQITKLLLRRLKENGGEAYKRNEVTTVTCKDKQIFSVGTVKGNEIAGDLFISNIDPKVTLQLVGADNFRKSYTNRIKSIENTISAFSLHVVLKPNSFKYRNKNYYHFKDSNDIWSAHQYSEDTWPKGYMISMGVKKDMAQWADNFTAITYMQYGDVKAWKDTYNTVASKNDRGQTYEEFKKEKTEIFLREIEKKFPEIRDCIQAIYTSTPLSYRDYIGSTDGAMYGYVKNANKPLNSVISPKTKIENLYFTGQSLNMHGILGVTISGVVTCSQILGKEYLLNKILEANKQIINSNEQ